MRRFLRSALVPAQILAVAAGCAPEPPERQDGVGSESIVKQGPLPVLNPALVFDSTTNLWSSISGTPQGPLSPSDVCPGSTTPTKLPFRQGATPWQLKNCWEGDAMPNGIQSGWATGAPSVNGPSVAWLTNKWVLTFSAKKSGSQQQCIGAARSTSVPPSPTGGSWAFDPNPLYCAPNGAHASDPELFYDERPGPMNTTLREWFLLWTEDVGPCQSRLMIQQVDPNAVAPDSVKFKSGTTPRELLTSANPWLGYSEISAHDCVGGQNGQRRRIESPTMVRADSGLWLFFSANKHDTSNYATGWAVCGIDSPAAGNCGVPNQLIPGSEFRPLWGVDSRTASWPTIATPFQGYPNLPGFGGMSVAVSAPTSTSPQPAFAAAQYLDGSAKVHAVFRLDKTGAAPMLFEPDPVTWHGAPNTFGDQGASPVYPRASTGVTTPSGQPVASRTVAGFAWDKVGIQGLFNTITTDGTYVTGALSKTSGNLEATSDFTRLGAFDPRLNRWQNIEVSTSTGANNIPGGFAAIINKATGGGGFISDVQALDDNTVAFVISSGLPSPYMGTDFNTPSTSDDVAPRMPTNGVWPSFGILSRDSTRPEGEQWRVTQQWTGHQLATLPGSDPALARQICPFWDANSPPTAPSREFFPPNVSICSGFNEIALLPKSKHLVITQYLVSDGDAGGIAIMSLTKRPGTNPVQYDPKWTAAFRYPLIEKVGTPSIRPMVEMVEADPKGDTNDERFIVSFDLAWKDTFGWAPNVLHEFSYKSVVASGDGTNPPRPYDAIVPTSPPIRAGDSALAQATYDKDGNLWAKGERGLHIYAKHGDGRKYSRPGTGSDRCGFVANKPFADYRTGTTFGQPCPPDYVILQAETLWWYPGPSTTEPSSFLFTHHPKENIVVGTNMGWSHTSDIAQLLPIRYQGSGANMTFEIGNVTNTALGHFDPATQKQVRPGAFDKAGRMWTIVHHESGDSNHWLAATDVNQLFNPPPVALSANLNGVTTIQAENIATTSMRACTQGTGSCDSSAVMGKLIDPPVLVQTSDRAQSAAPLGTGTGTVVVTDNVFVGHKAGPADYRVYVPRNGNYVVRFFAKAQGDPGAKIAFMVDKNPATTFTTTVSSTSWGFTASTTRALTKGVRTITLTPVENTSAKQWHLDYFTLTRAQ
jgi:hypothetical protein